MANKAAKTKTPKGAKPSKVVAKARGLAKTPEAPLTPRQLIFVREYLIDLNGTQAAIRAGYSRKTANEQSAQLLAKLSVSSAVETAMAERSRALKMEAEDVLREWITIARADPSELAQYIRTQCDECWTRVGDGLGTDRVEEIDPDCLKCKGRGWGQIIVTDTRTLTGPAKRLFAGVKVGKEGIEVKMRDQDQALIQIARHLGMFTEKVQHSGEIKTPTLELVVNHAPRTACSPVAGVPD